MPRSTLIFDGDCGVCTWSVDQLKRWVNPRAQVVAWQQTDLRALGVTEAECQRAVQFVDESGEHVGGGRAVAAVLKASPPPWPALGFVLDLPGIRRVTDFGYRVIAANRYRLPGSTPACQLPLPTAA
ncbi:MAG: DUF393 domain-containing protein [Candidatus Nanopelagicales bacterium]